MFPTRHLPRLALATACLAGMAVLASCDRSPTEPDSRPPVRRTVTITVRDSLGAPVFGADVWITSLFDSAGFATVVVGETDVDGETAHVLAEGAWLAWSGGGETTAGGGFVVAGPERAAADTQLVRLVRRASSRATGFAKLAGRTDHRGILVSCPGAVPFAVTDSTGAYALEQLAPGRWSVSCSMFGFAQGLTEVTVPAPGSAVTVPTVTMISQP